MGSENLKKIKIVVATIFQNGGDATRAIEVAKIIQKYKPKNYELDITFISRGSKFEEEVLRLGYRIYKAAPPMKGIRFQDDFKTKFGDLIGDKKLALEILEGEIKAYKDLQPDLLLYGFWPIGSIAQRMVIPETKTIAFLPLPLTEDFLNYVDTFPDEFLLARLPAFLQKVITKIIPKSLKLRSPALRHKSIQYAAHKLGYRKALVNTFEMLRSDRYLVNDFSVFYDTRAFGEKFVFTGPVYAKIGKQEINDERIRELLSNENRKLKIFCTLGSSGAKEHLLEIIKVFNEGVGREWSGIILSPKAICPLEEARALLNNDNVYITDQFVPAKEINTKVDVVICHGGQGTLQTAITSGTPLIGTATQPEQKINLEHLENFGMAIRIPYWQWKNRNIRKNVVKIASNKGYKVKAKVLQQIAENTKTDEIIAKAVWNEIIDMKQDDSRVVNYPKI